MDTKKRTTKRMTKTEATTKLVAAKPEGLEALQAHAEAVRAGKASVWELCDCTKAQIDLILHVWEHNRTLQGNAGKDALLYGRVMHEYGVACPHPKKWQSVNGEAVTCGACGMTYGSGRDKIPTVPPFAHLTLIYFAPV